MNLNDVSDYIYNDDLEIVSDYNHNIYGLFLNSKFGELLNLQNKSINYKYNINVLNFYDGNKNEGLKRNSQSPKNKEGVAIDINNNMSFIYIGTYSSLERLHKFNLYETFPIVIYDPSSKEDIEREIYGLE